jgi:TrmH family RNA methyltransferase
MTIINSRQNPRVKEAARLRDARQRKRQQRILIDGARELSRAMAAGLRMIEVFVCEELCRGPDAQGLLSALGGCGGEILPVSRPVFEKLAFGDRAEGVLGVAEMPRASLDALALPENPLVAVLEGVEKPGNIGAVLRSADGAGVSALIVADAVGDLYNPNAIRASLGTIFTVPVCAASAAETLAWLRRRGLRIFAARLDGSVAYTAADYRGPTALVLGSEAAGLSALWSAADVTAVRLPMLGAADSLNVSAAAAVLFYEARRQRGELSRQGRRRESKS